MSALGEVIVESLQELLRVLFSPVTDTLAAHANGVVEIIVGTPHPNAVFAAPTNGVWPQLYEYYWDTMVPLSLLLWAVVIGLVIFLESTSHLFSNYHQSKLKKRAFAGLLGILSWWWLAAISLRFMNALTGFLVPDLGEITLFQTFSMGAMGVLGMVVALTVDLVLFLLVGLIYFVRQVALYLFVLLMPLLMVFWVPGVGPFTLLSRFMKQLAGFYVPFLFMTVPVALLFRLGALLGSDFGVDVGGVTTWLAALVIPLVAVVSPFVLFWQAGALFFVAERAASHASAQQARQRAHSVRESGQTGVQGGRNFLRGARGEPAVKQDGQVVFGSGDSRAHSAGSRLNSTSSRLRGAVPSRDSNGGGSSGGGGRMTDGGSGTARENGQTTDDGRNADFSNVRGNRRGTDDRTHGSGRADDSADDTPRYIH